VSEDVSTFRNGSLTLNNYRDLRIIYPPHVIFNPFKPVLYAKEDDSNLVFLILVIYIHHSIDNIQSFSLQVQVISLNLFIHRTTSNMLTAFRTFSDLGYIFIIVLFLYCFVNYPDHDTVIDVYVY